MWPIGAMVYPLAAPWVQLSVSAGNRWPHSALRQYWLMPISCHFRDCKALLVTSLTHVSGAIASALTFNPLISTLKMQSNGPLYSNWYTGRWRVGCYIWYSEKGLVCGNTQPTLYVASMSLAVTKVQTYLIGDPIFCIFTGGYKPSNPTSAYRPQHEDDISNTINTRITLYMCLVSLEYTRCYKHSNSRDLLRQNV